MVYIFVYVLGLFVCIQSCEWFSGVNVHVCKLDLCPHPFDVEWDQV